MTKEVAKIEVAPPVQVIEESGSASLMRLINQAAMSESFDVAKLEKLLDVRERWEATEARKAFIKARAAFKAEAPTVMKNRRVGYQARGGGSVDYDYATLDQVADTLAPILAAHGLSYSWSMTQADNGLITVTCALSHEMGHYEQVSLQAMPDSSGNKNVIQQIGSTVTFLERYTLLAVTGIATKGQDDDGRGAGGGAISAEQKQTLVGLMKETEADTSKFLAFLKVEYIDDLPAIRFDQAVKALEAKKQQKKTDPAQEELLKKEDAKNGNQN